MRKSAVLIIGLILIFTFGSVQAGGSGRIEKDVRYAEDYDARILRGPADISLSGYYYKGIHLEAWDNDYRDENIYPLASAVYYFYIPRDTEHISVTVEYRNQSLASDHNGYAGAIWMRSSYTDDSVLTDSYWDYEYGNEDMIFYGNTYLLESDRSRETFEVSADAVAADGQLELHVMAGSGQSLDLRKITVESYRYAPRYEVVHVSHVDYVPDPFIYSFRYYYYGPWLCYRYPGSYVSFYFDPWDAHWTPDLYLNVHFYRHHYYHDYYFPHHRNHISYYYDPPDRKLSKVTIDTGRKYDKDEYTSRGTLTKTKVSTSSSSPRTGSSSSSGGTLTKTYTNTGSISGTSRTKVEGYTTSKKAYKSYRTTTSNSGTSSSSGSTLNKSYTTTKSSSSSGGNKSYSPAESRSSKPSSSSSSSGKTLKKSSSSSSSSSQSSSSRSSSSGKTLKKKTLTKSRK